MTQRGTLRAAELASGFGPPPFVCDNDHCRPSMELRADQTPFIDSLRRAWSTTAPFSLYSVLLVRKFSYDRALDLTETVAYVTFFLGVCKLNFYLVAFMRVHDHYTLFC